jgi:hypothetical protein
MKPVFLFLPALAFASGTAATMFWPAGEVPVAVALPPVEPVKSVALQVPGPGSVGAMALLASPTVDDLFKAVGLDRVVLMGRFIRTATSADLEQIFIRNRALGGGEVVFMGLAALKWIEIDREAALKFKPDHSVWWAFSKLDPNAAFAAAQDVDEATVQQVLNSIAQGNPTLVLRLLKENPQFESKYLWEGVLGALTEEQPAEAVRLALEKGLPLNKLAAYWALDDIPGAMACAARMEDPAARASFIEGVLSSLTAADPAVAFQEAAKLPEGPARSRHITASLAALARENPAAARPLIERLPAGTEREVALVSLAAALSDRDEDAAVTLLSTIRWDGISGYQSLKEPAAGEAEAYSPARAVVPAIQQLMTVAPLATANTLAALPPDPDIPLAPAIQRWAALQPEAASSWVKSQPEGPIKNEAIRGLNDWLTKFSPEPDFEAAVSWAAAATPDYRDQLYRSIITTWKREDRPAALAAAAKLPLSASQRAIFLQLFQ